MTNTSTSTARLRLVLRANAASSIIGGAVALIAASWVSRELGIDHVVLTRLLGAGLLGFAALGLAVARADEPQLVRDSLLVSLADAGWVLGTIVVLFTGVLTSTGNVVAAVVALAVADFGVTQMWFRSKVAETSPALRTAAA